jgi:hypothetical protein
MFENVRWLVSLGMGNYTKDYIPKVVGEERQKFQSKHVKSKSSSTSN